MKTNGKGRPLKAAPRKEGEDMAFNTSLPHPPKGKKVLINTLPDARLLGLLKPKRKGGLPRGTAAHLRVKRPRPIRPVQPRTAPRPRTPATPRPRLAAPLASASPSTAPPGEGGGGEGDLGGDGDPPPPPPPPPARPAKAKAKAKRGRPRRRRIFKLWPDGKAYRRRAAKIDAVAAALDGRPGALFATLVPLTPPSESERCLALISAAIADAARALHDALKDRGLVHALVPASRAKDGAFFPHWHALLGGISPTELVALAAHCGFRVHSEPLQDARAAARYAMAGHQRRHYDRISGSSGFFVHIPPEDPTYAPAPAPAPEAPVVSLGNTPPPIAQTLWAIAAAPPPGPVALAPGVAVIDVKRFLAALLQDLQHPSPNVRSAALDQARAFLAALSATGPPAPPSSPPTGKGVGGGGRP